MNAKVFELTILQNKNKQLHPDATKPQTAVKPDSNGNKGEYFHVSVKAGLKSAIGGVPVPQQTRSITFTIFKTGTRNEIFNLLEEVLANPANYDVINGNVKIHKTVLGFEGDLVAEDLDFAYEMIDSTTGKPIIDPVTKLPRLRRSISAFIFSSEDESGLRELIMAAEERRVRRHEVKTEEDATATTV